MLGWVLDDLCSTAATELSVICLHRSEQRAEKQRQRGKKQRQRQERRQEQRAETGTVARLALNRQAFFVAVVQLIQLPCVSHVDVPFG